MTKEEMAKAYADGFDESKYREIAYEAFICGFEAKCESNLPSNLDEAAKKIAYDVCKQLPNGTEKDTVVYYAILSAIAGAEWMAGQIDNESYEEKAEELYQDEYGIHCVVSVGTDYKPGDDLLVYTRKK